MQKSRHAERLIASQLEAPCTSWHVGAFGAIAEFHRDCDEALPVVDGIDIPSGAMRITCKECLPVAYELLSAHPAQWQHGVALCLPGEEARMQGRTVVTGLGADQDAIRPEERDQLLFDLGLGLRNVDFCVRTSDPVVIHRLQAAEGRPFLADLALFRHLQEASPHRVVVSRLGRIEVRQRIGQHGGTPPAGPHTHLLPQLLRGSRSHPATVPVPQGWAACLWFYPAHPIQDAKGMPRPFDSSAHLAFQELLREYGHRCSVEIKKKVFLAVRKGIDPARLPAPQSRFERIAAKVALRQVHWIEGPSRWPARWRSGCNYGETLAACDASGIARSVTRLGSG